jgi:hypothetical protein
MGRPLEDPAQRDELLLEQETRVPREHPGNALGRGVRAMRGAERIVHVQVEPRGELLRERGVVPLLLRMEAHVLEE